MSAAAAPLRRRPGHLGRLAVVALALMLLGCIHSGESYNLSSKPLNRCDDGYDNDFNGLTDAADPSCAAPFTCAVATCAPSGAACTSDGACSSGTCLHGKTRTCQ